MKNDLIILNTNDRGSFTIEAAVIISMIVIILHALIFLTFFLYNRCSVERSAAVGALRGSRVIWGSNAERIQAANEGIRDSLAYNLLASESVDTKTEVHGNKVYASVSGSIRDWNYDASYEKSVVNPVMLVRACRKASALKKHFSDTSPESTSSSQTERDASTDDK